MKRTTSAAPIFIALGAAAVFVACAGGGHYAGKAPSVAGDAPPVPLSADPHADIEKLMTEIGEKSTSPALNLPPPAPVPMNDAVCPESGCAVRTMAVVPASTDAACHHGAGETCTQACSLADTICVDASKICEIAKKLGNDAWAAGKCDSATTSCTDAHQRCCDCS